MTVTLCASVSGMTLSKPTKRLPPHTQFTTYSFGFSLCATFTFFITTS